MEVTWLKLNPAAGTTGWHETYDDPPQTPIRVLEVDDSNDDEVVITYVDA